MGQLTDVLDRPPERRRFVKALPNAACPSLKALIQALKAQLDDLKV